MKHYANNPKPTALDLERMAPLRRCHDCGAPTRDYRCPRCRRAFRRKHNVKAWDLEADLDFVELGF